jgi:hypothetical protein
MHSQSSTGNEEREKKGSSLLIGASSICYSSPISEREMYQGFCETVLASDLLIKFTNF